MVLSGIKSKADLMIGDILKDVAEGYKKEQELKQKTKTKEQKKKTTVRNIERW